MLRAVRLAEWAAWVPKRAPRLDEVHDRAPRAGERPILDPNWPKRESEGQKVLRIAAKVARERTARRRQRSEAAKCCACHAKKMRY